MSDSSDTQTRIFRCDGCGALTWQEGTTDDDGNPVWKCRNCFIIGPSRQVTLVAQPDGSVRPPEGE